MHYEGKFKLRADLTEYETTEVTNPNFVSNGSVSLDKILKLGCPHWHYVKLWMSSPFILNFWST